MTDHTLLKAMIVFLAAAAIAVPISKKLGFGSVLGYLAAGIAIGPHGMALISSVEQTMHFSEFGVVLLLFLIGLELNPAKLWQMRVPIFGMGTAQLVATASIFFLLGLLAGAPWQLTLVASFGFALSSTAIALQVMNEKKFLATSSGKAAFSILLFQDIAVIPMLALLPLLATTALATNLAPHRFSFLETSGILLLVIVIGRLLLQRIFRWIAKAHLREVFTATTLLLVTGMAYLMQSLELSMGLGAFIAGVLLADSEFRHALETDIEPFKGLLLGLFFISVGMSVDLAATLANPLMVIGIVIVIFAVKASVQFGISKFFRLPSVEISFFTIVLAQVGEFAFVLFGAAAALGILSPETAAPLLASSALSMLLTPVCVKIHEYWEAKRENNNDRAADSIIDDSAPVIIAGFGRVGQIVGRLLFANGIKATVLDYEPEQIELLRRFGFQVYYGDATRIDLLTAAGAAHAKILVAAIDDVESNLHLVDVVRQNFPNLKIISRARNVSHLFELMDRGVTDYERETFDSSLRLGRRVLESLGVHPSQAHSATQFFRSFDLNLMNELHAERGDEKSRISKAKQAREDIIRLFSEEEARIKNPNNAWGD